MKYTCIGKIIDDKELCPLIVVIITLGLSSVG
jgi:hypothetical protein